MGYHSGTPDSASLAAQQAAGQTDLVTPAARAAAEALAAAGVTSVTGTGAAVLATAPTLTNAILVGAKSLIAGANLTNVDATINPGTDAASIYTMPAATMNAARVITLGVTGTLIAGVSTVWIERRDLTANTLTIRNGGTNGTVIPDVVLPASPGNAMRVGATYDGVDWIPHTVVYVR
jgi:hypothetical protein